MKNLSIITIIFCIVCSTCLAQINISSSQLKGTKWKRTDITSKSIYEYTDKQKIWTSEFGNNHFYSYYLCSTPPISFDFSKVGKETNGCYLVEWNSKLKRMEYFTVISFDKSGGKLVLYYKCKGSLDCSDTTMEYKMIKWFRHYYLQLPCSSLSVRFWTW